MCSAAGSLAAAVGVIGTIYVSTNSGTTWQATSAPLKFWQTIASSADGNKLVAGVQNGFLYVSQSTSAPSLNISYSEGDAVLSWIVPSRSFTLQENPGLTTTNWTTVTATPTVTNLQNHVVVSPATGNRFYRLALQ